MKKTILSTIGILAAIALSIGAYLSNPPTPAPVIQKVGSVTSPEISSPYISVNNVNMWHTGINLATATNTPCDIISPAATSTLTRATLQITTGTSTATVWRLATSTAANSTTSSMYLYSVASGAQASLVFTGTSTDKNILAPNTHVVFGVEGTAIADATKLLGTCTASFSQF